MFNLFKLLHIAMRSLYISILCSEAYHVNWLSKLHVNAFGPAFFFSLSLSLDIPKYSVTCIWHDIERCTHKKYKQADTLRPCTVGSIHIYHILSKRTLIMLERNKKEKKNHSLNTYQLSLRSFSSQYCHIDASNMHVIEPMKKH